MRKIWILAIMLGACNGDNGPPPPPPPECPANQVWDGSQCVCGVGLEWSDLLGSCWVPRQDRWINWEEARGVTAFSLTVREPDFIWAFCQHIKANGWNTLRTFSHINGEGWCVNDEDYLPCGPEFGSEAYAVNLRKFLEVTARAGVWVELIPIFGKDHDEGSPQANVNYFNEVFDNVNHFVQEEGYRHVVWEAFNEVIHPLSNHIKDEDVERILLHMQASTSLPVTTDHPGGRIGEWEGRYPYIWRDDVDFFAFHPPRNPQPSRSTMEAAQEKWKYGVPVWCDETVSWASDLEIERHRLKGKGTIALKGYGTDDERMGVVVKHLKDIYSIRNSNGLRWVPFYHSIWGIESKELGRIPNFDQDIGGGQ